MNKRNTSKEKNKENKGFPYKSKIKLYGLYTCIYCNEKVDINHVCEKNNKMWKAPQSRRSKMQQLLNNQNKVRR